MYKYGHRTRGHPKLQKLLAFVFALVMLVTMVPADLAKADAIEHTHIWATTYDSTNHWEYCTVCGEKRNVTTHVFTDHWAFGYESCNDNNYDQKICSCGYSYVYHKPHDFDWSKIADIVKTFKCHRYKCKSCGEVTSSVCRHNGSVINCKNYGTCDTCGVEYTADEAHTINGGGTCNTCGYKIFDIIDATFDYSDDYSKGTFMLKIKPLYDYVDFDSVFWFATPVFIGAFSGNESITNVDQGRLPRGKGYTLDSDGVTRIYKWNFTFTSTNRTRYYLCLFADVNGATYRCENGVSFTIYSDHVAPSINTINQTPQQYKNGYATINTIDISGEENVSNVVYLSIKNKQSNKTIIDNAAVTVTDNKYSYTTTPPLEGSEAGNVYTVTVKDLYGNTSTKDFTVYNTDGTAPQVESPLSYTDWTNTAKTITVTFTDYGSGGVQASLGDQTHYQACTKTADGKYQITYTFSDDITGTKVYPLYLKDALGNATDTKLTIGNIDKNTYSISYDLNGGAMSGQKTSYTVADSFTLPTPTKTGYTFTGWTGSNGTTPQDTVTINKGTRGNLNYTANWSANTYTNQIGHWAEGFKYSEGNNGNKTALGLKDTRFSASYKSNIVMDSAKAVKIPNGYYLRELGTPEVDGTFKGYSIGLKLTQKPAPMWFEYYYAPISYSITYNLNGGTNNSANPSTYNVLYGISLKAPTRAGYTFTGWYDESGNKVTGINEGCNAKFSSADDLYAKLATRTTGNRTLTAHWEPIHYTIKYDANGGAGTMADSTQAYMQHSMTRKNTFTREGWKFLYWYASKQENGITKWIYESPVNYAFGWYEKDKQPSGWHLLKYPDGELSHNATTIDGDVLTFHAQWQYKPVSVKVPQMLIGDHTGKSQFRVKCDDFKAGSIKVTVPSSFPYKQTGKADVTAAITAKSGNNTITPTNKVCVYNITTTNGLSAGCWQGSFNIGLTLTKE